jgi:uncharacterized membrane protein
MSEPTVPPPPSYNPPPPPPPSYGPGGPGGPSTASPNRNIMIVLSYLWALALIPLIVEKEDREVQWHAKHGLVLFVAELIIGFLLSFLTTALAFMHLGCGGCLFHSAFGVVVLVVHILCIVKGVNGERFIVPGISQFADRF